MQEPDKKGREDDEKRTSLIVDALPAADPGLDVYKRQKSAGVSV